MCSPHSCILGLLYYLKQHSLIMWPVLKNRRKVAKVTSVWLDWLHSLTYFNLVANVVKPSKTKKNKNLPAKFTISNPSNPSPALILLNPLHECAEYRQWVKIFKLVQQLSKFKFSLPYLDLVQKCIQLSANQPSIGPVVL